MSSIEVLILGEESTIGTATLNAAVRGAVQAGLKVTTTQQYAGDSDWLCIYGAGELKRNAARKEHIRRGGHVACWDLGYFGRSKDKDRSYVRVSIDHFHPQAYLGDTPPEPGRWEAHGVALREDADPAGPIIVVGMGPKSKSLLGINDWELRALQDARDRFPGRPILYRPKRDALRIEWKQDGDSPIETLLHGASLAICRHSNVAIDACIAGVPVECEDGAARWLYSRGANPNADERLDFLRRLAWFQWRLSEMREAWSFLTKVCGSTSVAGGTRLMAGFA